MTQSLELTTFYRAYAKWLDEGAPHEKPFYRGNGLCGSLYDYLYTELVVKTDLVEQAFLYEIRSQFEDAKLDRNFPFNEGSRKAFLEEMKLLSFYLNPKRIQWVTDHCNQGASE
jgi:hypothetical protein